MEDKNVIGNLEEVKENLSEEMDLDDIEEALDQQINEKLAELAFLEKEHARIGSPEALGETIKTVIWEQFVNQIGVTAGEDFIKENKGMNLDLSDEAHIQTAESFAEGNIAAHNTEIDYQERYESWQEQLVVKQDQNGNPQTVLAAGAREPYDANRPMGSAAMHKDHTIPVAEIVKDPEAAAHLTEAEKIAFANSDKNINDLDASANQSKGDKSMEEWLASERNGQKPAERFNIDEEALREKDKEAREEYKQVKEKGKERSIEAGRTSQAKEAFRVGGDALKAVAMQLFAALIKEIIAKLIKWFKSAKRKASTLIASIKAALKSFIKNLKKHLLNASDSFLTTIFTAIFGPVVSVIKKVWIFLKQGWKSLKAAVKYIKNPENKHKPIGILIAEVGKIIIAGLSAGAAIVLGETITVALSGFPLFAIEIPMLGSLAGIIGIFMGAAVAGIIGAIAINKIDKYVSKRLKSENTLKRIEAGNSVLDLQQKALVVAEEKLVAKKEGLAKGIRERHQSSAQRAKDIHDKVQSLKAKQMDNQELIADIDNLLAGL